MCISPQRHAILRHLKRQKWSKHAVFCTFWLSNVHFATAACNFATSEQTKVVQTCGVLHILTCKCAFRHSARQFFNIRTYQSGPNTSCFVHFDLQMCFSPQRRTIFEHPNFKKWSRTLSFLTFLLPNVLCATAAYNFSASELPKVHFRMCFSPQWRAIFRHLNRQKWSKHAVFCTFWLSNVLFATAACNFSTSEQTKVLRTRHVLYILTFKCAFRHSGVQFLISPRSTDLRTRRFNRPTFRLTRHTNHWKNTAFRDFSNIWRGCIFFLLTFALLHLLSTDLTTLLLLFNSPYCRKFLFKLPSIILLFQYINVALDCGGIGDTEFTCASLGHLHRQLVIIHPWDSSACHPALW